ncbi:MAG: hypothetical protein VXB01_06210 [Opitutae bacterium]
MFELYKRFSLREKTLFIGFIWFVLLFWGSGGISRFSQTLRGISDSRKAIAGQKEILSREAGIDADLEAQRSKFDSSSTYNKDQLFARVQAMAEGRASNIYQNKEDVQEGGIFNLHTVRITFRDQPISSLLNFDQALQEEPYISLESATIAADTKKPELLDATFIITSFELKQP